MANEVMSVEALSNNEVAVYCSAKCETEADTIKLFNVTNAPEHRLGDHINETIEVKDVFCEMVTVTNEDTGVISEAPRIVLIDKKGEGYACVSLGIFSALKKLFAMFGAPTWEKPVKIKIIQIKKGAKNILSIKLA